MCIVIQEKSREIGSRKKRDGRNMYVRLAFAFGKLSWRFEFGPEIESGRVLCFDQFLLPTCDAAPNHCY